MERDPFAGAVGVPASMNGYSYVHGNPVTWTDPSGEILLALAAVMAGAALGSVFSAGIDVVSQLASGVSFDCLNWGQTALAAIEGAIFGAMGGGLGELRAGGLAGLVHLRARAYNPRLGVFMQRDPFAGAAGVPASMNGYSDVHRNGCAHFPTMTHRFAHPAAFCATIPIMLTDFRPPRPISARLAIRLCMCAATWVARVALVWTLLGWFNPAPPRAPFMPPQTVQTTQPRLCVHTRLIDEVEEWKIQRTLIMVREMGAATVVEFFPWAYIEYAPEQYYWGQADRIIQHAHNQGLRVIARLGFVPAWARDDAQDTQTTLNTLPPDAYPAFARFVSAFAARYAGVVDHLIIWNEPNLAFEWGYQTVDPAGYARLLQAVYAPAHAANPNVMILAAGLAPTLEPRGSPHGLNDLLYLDDLYAAGGGAYFDALAAHTYGFTQLPDADPAPDALNFRRAEWLHAIMARYGDDRPVYITETGWNDHPRWTLAVPPSARIAYTVGALDWMSAHWAWVDALCIWMFRTPAATFSYPDYFTLVGVDFQPKPIYRALQAYARGAMSRDPLWLPPPA